MIRHISPMILILYRIINFGYTTHRNPRFPNPLIFGFQITSEMRNRLVSNSITKTKQKNKNGHKSASQADFLSFKLMSKKFYLNLLGLLLDRKSTRLNSSH